LFLCQTSASLDSELKQLRVSLDSATEGLAAAEERERALQEALQDLRVQHLQQQETLRQELEHEAKVTVLT
jgi:TolA-binding protein